MRRRLGQSVGMAHSGLIERVTSEYRVLRRARCRIKKPVDQRGGLLFRVSRTLPQRPPESYQWTGTLWSE
jgi:hypothetical protein